MAVVPAAALVPVAVVPQPGAGAAVAVRRSTASDGVGRFPRGDGMGRWPCGLGLLRWRSEGLGVMLGCWGSMRDREHGEARMRHRARCIGC